MTKPIGVGASDADALGYDTFVADPIPMNVAGPLPNGESLMYEPLAVGQRRHFIPDYGSEGEY